MSEYPYSNLLQGDIIIYPIPYKDRTTGRDMQKNRPTLVMSRREYNSVKQNSNLVVFPITSKKRVVEYDVTLTKKDVDFILKEESFVRTDKPAVIEKVKIIKKLGTVKGDFIRMIKNRVKQFYGITDANEEEISHS